MKMKDVTPTSYFCPGGACPAVYKTDRGTYLIVGSRVRPEGHMLSDRIAPHETMIEVPAGLIREIVIG